MAKVSENTPLTLKQEKFCQEYVKLGNASDAYRIAFKNKKAPYKQINEQASIMLSLSKISKRVDEIRDKTQKECDISRQRILDELSSIAFSSIANLHKTWIERKDFDMLSDKDKASIKSISTKILKKNIGTHDDPEIVDVEYVKIELYDKMTAMQTINRMLGYDAPKEVNIRQTILDIETGLDDEDETE